MDDIDAEHELLATFALLTDDRRKQAVFIARAPRLAGSLPTELTRAAVLNVPHPEQ